MTLDETNQSEQDLTEQIDSTVSGKPVLESLPEDYQAVLDHILFHKALISDESDGSRLNQYLEVVSNLRFGTHIAISNPYDKSIAITFQLAIEQHLDPWDIDLNEFAKEYLKRIEEHEEFDLVTVGRIIYMAYQILKLKSDRVLSNAENIEIEEDELWEPSGDWYTDDVDFLYTSVIQKQRTPPIREMVWRKGKRPVTLLELVGALEEASKEAEILKILNEKRRQQREYEKKLYRSTINENMHKEDLEADISIVYERICEFNGYPIPFSDICEPTTENEITTLVSSLYLANRRKINIWQPDFPFGKIYVENLQNKRDRAPPLPGDPAEDRKFHGLRKRLREQELGLKDSEIQTDEKDNGGDSKDKKRKKPKLRDIITSETRIAS
ncbi:MAG: segregation/condensation protein A [Thermoplasmata archaeon]|nr:MAG: segregation/condensation protein A [Thermoplasmata archaeon]